MTLWQRISEAIAALASGEGLATVFDRLRGEPMQTVAFTIAVIALGAKMAKADGQVTRDEVAVFRQIFQIAPEDEAQAARVFNLARQDVAGFDSYARKIAEMFGDKHATLVDLLEGLFHIAVADGCYHEAENAFLKDVATIFGLNTREFKTLRARFVPDAPRDPYEILGASPDMSATELRACWRALIRENHPDRLAARGVPPEAIKLAEARLVKINEAWDILQKAKTA
ncbi:MAG: molecular chaperone DjiA [Litoreibacter sp.]